MSQRRFELSDFDWSVIEPLLPNKPRGVSRVDDRRALHGISRTVDNLVDRIGQILDRLLPAECANFFHATGYQR